MLLAAPSTVAPLAIRAEDSAVGGDVLRMMLDTDTLLFGCIALALLAMVTVSRVAVKRRKSRRVRREAQAQTQAIHEFLENLRESPGTARQGVWHYDFVTGAQRSSDELKALFGGETAANDPALDFARFARENEAASKPYEARFAINGVEGAQRCFVLRACNLPGAGGTNHRALAIVREIEPPAACD
ncbi:hypothetical protein MWU38_01780 [Qipengyuania sp. S6317L1]|uniref:hypothetical protein n=1 Tax=Qipengyuania sp. S6317L1 TaxID=2926410 RepID=UPI001FF69B8F|nr:hypothetical protein [Qipengyuania sp. S6317L1]MCK0098100.1 hypothetical protein [Qipengyuania sp. S6317L1]